MVKEKVKSIWEEVDLIQPAEKHLISLQVILMVKEEIKSTRKNIPLNYLR